MSGHLRECVQRAEERLNWLYQIEDLPFTLNQHYLTDYKSKFLTYYRETREDVVRGRVATQVKNYRDDPTSHTVNTYGTTSKGGRVLTGTEPSAVAKAMSALAEMGITGIRPEDLYKILPEDEMSPAMNIMADVRAYFQGTCLSIQCIVISDQHAPYFP